MVLTEAAVSNLDAVYVFTDDTDILTYIENEYAWNQNKKRFCALMKMQPIRLQPKV
jgi:hypothetical protein